MKLTLQEFLKWKPEFPEPIVSKGVMYKGSKVILYGKYKSLKSMLVQRLALALANGQPWLGFETRPCKVSYLQLEISEALLHKRLMRMTAGNHMTDERLVIWSEHFLKLDTEDGLRRLEDGLKEDRPDVLIIDPIYKVVLGNMLDAQSVIRFLDIIDVLISKYGLSVILVSHSRKPDMKQTTAPWGTDDLLGSTFFSAWADSVIQVQRGDQSLIVKFEVIRHAEEEIEPVVVVMNDRLEFERKESIQI